MSVNYEKHVKSVNDHVKIKKLRSVEEIHNALISLIPNNITNEDVVYLCIGTDRSTGDSLGPLIGMYLAEMGYKNVHGTINNPVHAMNLQETINNLPKNKIVIAIDASLGTHSFVNTVTITKGTNCISPGAGIGKELPSVGDYGIAGVVNVGGFMEFFVLQNTSLSVVIKMAKNITSALVKRFPLPNNFDEINRYGYSKYSR